MKQLRQQSKDNVPLIPQQWKDKVLSVIPHTHIGRFVSCGEKCIHIRTADDTSRMTLEWVNGEHDALYIKDLNVSKAHRNKGLGKQLLDIAALIAQKTGRLKLCVLGRLTESQTRWLEKYGFFDSDILYSIDILEGYIYDDIESFVSDDVLYIKYITS